MTQVSKSFRVIKVLVIGFTISISLVACSSVSQSGTTKSNTTVEKNFGNIDNKRYY